MPRSGGIYTLPAGNPVVTLTVISSTWANTTLSDVATALTASLPVDGTAPMTGVLRLIDGASGAPGLTWATETTSGWYRIGLNQFGFSVGTVNALSVNANRGWNIPAPVAGAALTVNGNLVVTAPASGAALSVSSAGLTTIASFDSTRAGGGIITLTNSGTIGAFIGTGTDVSAGVTLGDLVLAAGTAARSIQLTRGGGNGLALTVAGTGAVTIALPSAGTGLTIVGGGFAVSAGTSAVQALTATTGAFSALLSANLGLTVAGAAFTSRGITDSATATALTIAAGGNVTINAPSSGIALTVSGGVGGQAAQLSAPSGGNGLLVNAGALSTDVCVRFFNGAGTTNFFEIFGDGHGFLGSSGPFTWTTAGNFAIAAPSSGTALALPNTASAVVLTGANISLGIGTAFLAGQSEFYTSSTNPIGIGTSGAAALHLYTNSVLAVTIASGGAVSIVNPSSGNPLTITTASAGNALVCSDGTNTSTVIAFSAAHRVQIGSTAAFDFDLLAQGTVVATLSSGMRIGAPTGGDQGAGTLNATGLFVNGIPILKTVVKTADTTRTNNAVVSADPDLTFNVVAGHRYYFKFVVYINSASAGGVQWATAITGTVTAPSYAISTRDMATGGFAASTAANVGAGGGSLGTAAASSVGDWAIVEGQINALTSGAIAFSWAQNTSNAAGTAVGAGSYGTLTQLS